MIARAAVGVSLLAALVSGLLVRDAGRSLGARSITAQLVAMREAIFSRPTDDPAAFLAPPARLRELGFLTDTRALPGPLFEGARTSTGGAVDRALALLGSVPWRNSPFCKVGVGLTDKARSLLAGRTCCSDNVELFLAELARLAVFARELHTSRHVVAEIWDDARAAWVFVDPSYGIMAFDEAGAAISLIELRSRMLEGRPYELRFVGGELAREGKASPREIDFYDAPDELANLALVMGNNVLDVDAAREALPLPEAARQALGLLAGTDPRTLILADASNETARKLEALRPRAIALLASIVATLAAIAWWFLAARRARVRARVDSR